MIDTLKKFTDGTPLFYAVSALLAKLNIEFDRETAEPINVADLCEQSMPQYFKDALNNIENTYFIGIANNDSLQGLKNAESLDSVAETMQNKGKYDGMFIFACDAKSNANLTRSTISALTRAFNRIASANPVILFVRQGKFLSLSTCERTTYSQEWRQGSGEKLGRVNILRDINCEHTHRGHLDLLSQLNSDTCDTFDKLYQHWMNIFDTKLLTKSFYNDLFSWYQWAVDPKTKVSFPGDADTQNDDREDIDTRVIRLITRLMFVWFIKQKGLVPDKIFDVNYLKSILVDDFDPYSSIGTEYYQAILQNLFFGTLNRAIIEDGIPRMFAKASNKSDTKNLYRYEELFKISEQGVIDIFARVPFLNCGLFECLDKTKTLDGVSRRYYNDGFSRNDKRFADGTFKYRAVVPNILFFHPEKGILSIFNKYVFTIEENTPQDIQVALDPELLGKVFENLLGVYNPETKETARNQSGSFYTPREIVQFIVNETLISHLKHTVGEELECKYRELLDFSTENIELSDSQKKSILHSLFTCKIIDPACGSGAFPMGMLQQMVHILQQVDPDNTQWREILLNLAVDESRRAFGIIDENERQKKLLEIDETFSNAINSPDYTRKLYIIESCIYGIDIQPIAMLITRLRFFITLICEQRDIKWDKPEENFGIKTLPNLESKFVAANSLINADIHKYNEDWTNNQELSILKDELMSIRRKHFYTRKRNEKIKLLREDEKKRIQIHELINKLVGEPNQERISELKHIIIEQEALLSDYKEPKWVEEGVQLNLFDPPAIVKVDVNKRKRDSINALIASNKREIERELNKSTPTGFEAAVLQITDWNPYDQNAISPFLDTEWMFGVLDGFDIVIGNPPYIQLSNNGGALGNLYKNCGYETFASTGDIYCLFYERGYQLLKQGGHLCYITSNKWMRAGYGEKTRDFFEKSTNPKLLLDFAGIKIFESATVDTNILLFSKEENQKHTVCSLTSKENKNCIKNLSDFVQQHHTISEFTTSDSWVILSEIEQSIKRKIEAVGTPLKDWDINIYRGVLTGCNEAFIISSQKRDEILTNCTTEEERARTAELIRPILRGRDIKRYGYDWADLWLIATFPSRHYNIEDYQSVKKYLLSFGKERLEQTGRTYIVNGEKVKARKKTNNKWFETQDSISYWDDFSKPKIIYPNMTKYMPFVYDDKSYVTNQKCFIITGNHVAYLTAFLNSSLFKYCFRDSFPELQGGTRELSKIFFDKIPVYMVTNDQEQMFNKAIEDIQYEYTKQKAQKIDSMLFDLYNLTHEERKAIGFVEIQ